MDGKGIKLTQTGVQAGDEEVMRLAREFEATGCALLPAFLASPIVATMVKCLGDARFVVKNEVHNGSIFGTTLFVPDTEPALVMLHFLLNRPEIYQFISRVADTPPLRNFTGRIHRTLPDTAHHIDWHDDTAFARTVGLCINLGTESYSGGLFQLRDEKKEMRSEVRFHSPGDAFVFRIDRSWQHRLTPVESGSRTVGVGWYRTMPDWQSAAGEALRSRPKTH